MSNFFVVVACFLRGIAAFHFSEVDAGEDGVPAYVIPLRRESVPVVRHNKTVSFKTSYSGLVHMGTPLQEYRVVFDTGSGNLILPDSNCDTDACRTGDKKFYNLTDSSTGYPITARGRIVEEGEERPNVKIGFGLGGIRGEFVRDIVCISPNIGGNRLNITEPYGPMTQHETHELQHDAFNQASVDVFEKNGDFDLEAGCVRMNVLSAIEMSTNPFYYFKFDGILGLGLKKLTVTKEFSYFDVLSRSAHIREAKFGVFLTEGDNGEVSEIAMGGYDKRRILEPLAYSPVALQYIGYWQVQILAVRINGVLLDICNDGTCRGVVDTGTSHLGIPADWKDVITDGLSINAGDLLDCRLSVAPELQFELETTNITLRPQDYMRRLPLREGVSVQSPHGVSDKVAPSLENSANGSLILRNRSNATGNESDSNTTQNDTNSSSSELELNATNVTRHCSPRTIAVNLSAPVGPKLFILGEPVLHRYYTVYDWENLQVGFALANNRGNTDSPPDPSFKGTLPDDVELLMQFGNDNIMEVEDEILMQFAHHSVHGEDEESILMQQDKFEIHDSSTSPSSVEIEVLLCAAI